MTKLCGYIDSLTGTALAVANPREVEKKLLDVKKSAALYAAIQDQVEELIAGQEGFEAEAAAGEDAKEANEQLVEKLEVYSIQLNLYLDGGLILDSLEKLLATDNLNSNTYKGEV